MLTLLWCYSFLENPVDGGAFEARVHGVTKSQTWLSDLTFTVLSNDLKVHLLCNKCYDFLLCMAICCYCVCMCVYRQFTFKQCRSWEADTIPTPSQPLNSTLHIYSYAFVDSAKLRLLYYWSMCLLKRTMCKWTHIVKTGVSQGSTMYAWVNVWPSSIFY